MTEVWRSIPSHPRYWVSDQGRVRGADRIDTAGNRRRGRILKPRPAGSAGHLQVVLMAGGVRTPVYVHIAMARAFLDNPDNLPVVRHLNDVATDNRLDNLAFGTSADNAADWQRNRKQKENTHA